MATHMGSEREIGIAVFIDFDNIAVGVRQAKYKSFDIGKVLDRILEKGKIMVKRAYASWSRFEEYKRDFHASAIELIDIPHSSISGKNSADIRLVCDALDLALSKDHLQAFVIVSGDSDFSPLVSKLRENNKYVIGLGVKSSTSKLLTENCDEFIYYEDIVRPPPQARRKPKVAGKRQEAFDLVSDALDALLRENYEIIWGSMVKQTIKRKLPSFDESYYGYRTFSRLLEDASRHHLIHIEKDQKSGTYMVNEVGDNDGDGDGIEV